MKTTPRGTVDAFADGRRAIGGTLMTDGRSLWSYGMKIAQRTTEGIVVGDYTRTGGGFMSRTTSKHVALAKKKAHTIMLPELFTELYAER